MKGMEIMYRQSWLKDMIHFYTLTELMLCTPLHMPEVKDNDLPETFPTGL
jgi:hypothetical protein